MRKAIALVCAMMAATPVAAANVYEFAAGTPQLSQFASAMRSTGIDKALANPGPYTIFAPTDAAFAKMPRSALSSNGREELVQILTCHMAPTALVENVLATGKPVAIRTVGGCNLVLYRSGSQLVVRDDTGRDHRVEAANLSQSNGTVNIVDSLILPAS
ncbi:fasciclin domain-containing protein [Falsirhodobacter sp. alg1]|uniref:fasciclin domain-containing protein n=1 Tax=Falsirhodobacter sp. alg1 TaxID=1472418 RepID=UPI0005ED9C14|nr:fasciclin domain-containing protein [Falsirhodobacter sp. alg1]